MTVVAIAMRVTHATATACDHPRTHARLDNHARDHDPTDDRRDVHVPAYAPRLYEEFHPYGRTTCAGRRQVGFFPNGFAIRGHLLGDMRLDTSLLPLITRLSLTIPGLAGVLLLPACVRATPDPSTPNATFGDDDAGSGEDFDEPDSDSGDLDPDSAGEPSEEPPACTETRFEVIAADNLDSSWPPPPPPPSTPLAVEFDLIPGCTIIGEGQTALRIQCFPDAWGNADLQYYGCDLFPIAAPGNVLGSNGHVPPAGLPACGGLEIVDEAVTCFQLCGSWLFELEIASYDCP